MQALREPGPHRPPIDLHLEIESLEVWITRLELACMAGDSAAALLGVIRRKRAKSRGSPGEVEQNALHRMVRGITSGVVRKAREQCGLRHRIPDRPVVAVCLVGEPGVADEDPLGAHSTQETDREVAKRIVIVRATVGQRQHLKARADYRGGGCLLARAEGCNRVRGDIRVAGAQATVREHGEVHVVSKAGQLGECAAASEFGVVRMWRNREYAMPWLDSEICCAVQINLLLANVETLHLDVRTSFPSRV